MSGITSSPVATTRSMGRNAHRSAVRDVVARSGRREALAPEVARQEAGRGIFMSDALSENTLTLGSIILFGYGTNGLGRTVSARNQDSRSSEPPFIRYTCLRVHASNLTL